MKGYMKEKLLILQLFGDETDGADNAAAMGDGSCAESAVQNAQQPETDIVPTDLNCAEDDMMQYDSEEKSDDSGVSDEEDTEQSGAVSEEKSKKDDTFLPCERIISEADRLSEKVDGFDLEKELKCKSFTAMLKCGLSVEAAYNAVHFEELIAAAVQNAREEAWREILTKAKLGEMRPAENGAASGAAIQSRAGVENLTGRGIREILRRVENGAKIKF